MNKLLQKIQLTSTVIFLAGILLVAIIVTGLTLSNANETLRKQVSILVSANSKQLELNIDNYIEEVQQKAALLFSSEAYYGYDETDDSIDPYDKLQYEQAISEKIVDLGIMENFSDYGVVYSDDKTLGWISQVTKAMFPSGGIYQAFSDTISRDAVEDGWSYGINGNYDRLYYTKRLNPHALVIASIYNWELESVFELPAALNDMTVRLVNDDGIILYSSRSEEASKPLPENITAMLSKLESGSVMNDEYLVTKNACQNGWHVICSMSVEAMTRENTEMAQRTIFFVACICLVLMIGGILLYRIFNRSVTGMVTDLNDRASHDLMTGLLNKTSFQALVREDLEKEDAKLVQSFIMLDLDNFKKVNDQLGHSVGDDVLIRMSRLLQHAFPDHAMIGRMGGDEFAVYRCFPGLSYAEASEASRDEIQHLYTVFAKEYAKERESCQISVSAGVLLLEPGKHIFEEVYVRADDALYEAKRSGKDRPTFVS